MKTIQFTGTEYKIENLHLALGISDNDMPQQSETRVYVVDFTRTLNEDLDIRALTDEDFMIEAERQGTVFTLEGFQSEVNYHDFYMDESYIRFINVIKFD